MQLTAKDSLQQQEIPYHYVLVIDVSGSMHQIYGKGTASLLERFKVCVWQCFKAPLQERFCTYCR